MTTTEEYIGVLIHVKSGELGLLRQHAGQSLDHSVDGFDLFSGLWWPLRAKSQRTPRREVAWLIAKLYARRPIGHSSGPTLAFQLGRVRPGEKKARRRFDQRFDGMLSLPLGKIEPSLGWALGLLASGNSPLDWVKLTDDLSNWERETTRCRWAIEFLKNSMEVNHAH